MRSKSSIAPPLAFQYERQARSIWRWISASGRPDEKGGRASSALLGSPKALGALGPLSTAPQPSSVSHIGLLLGTHAVGVADRTPPTRLWWGWLHQFSRSL